MPDGVIETQCECGVQSAEKLEERRAKNAEHSIGNVLLHLFAGNKEKD